MMTVIILSPQHISDLSPEYGDLEPRPLLICNIRIILAGLAFVQAPFLLLSKDILESPNIPSKLRPSQRE